MHDLVEECCFSYWISIVSLFGNFNGEYRLSKKKKKNHGEYAITHPVLICQSNLKNPNPTFLGTQLSRLKDTHFVLFEVFRKLCTLRTIFNLYHHSLHQKSFSKLQKPKKWLWLFTFTFKKLTNKLRRTGVLFFSIAIFTIYQKRNIRRRITKKRLPEGCRVSRTVRRRWRDENCWEQRFEDSTTLVPLLLRT